MLHLFCLDEGEKALEYYFFKVLPHGVLKHSGKGPHSKILTLTGLHRGDAAWIWACEILMHRTASLHVQAWLHLNWRFPRVSSYSRNWWHKPFFLLLLIVSPIWALWQAFSQHPSFSACLPTRQCYWRRKCVTVHCFSYSRLFDLCVNVFSYACLSLWTTLMDVYILFVSYMQGIIGLLYNPCRFGEAAERGNRKEEKGAEGLGIRQGLDRWGLCKGNRNHGIKLRKSLCRLEDDMGLGNQPLLTIYLLQYTM